MSFEQGDLVFIIYHVASDNAAQHLKAVSLAKSGASPGDYQAADAFRISRDNVNPGINIGAIVAETYSGLGPVRLRIGNQVEEVHPSVVSHFGDVSNNIKRKFVDCGISWSHLNPSVSNHVDTFKQLFLSGEMAKNDNHAARFATFISTLVDQWMYCADNAAFDEDTWSFEKEAVYTYWALFQTGTNLGSHARAWTLQKMFQTFWDDRPSVKTFGNNSLLSKFLWVNDKKRNNRLTTAFAIDATADRVGSVKISCRREDESDNDFLKRSHQSTHRKTGGGSNLDIFVDCQVYLSFKKELKIAKKECLKIDDYPPHLKDVEQWLDEHKWLRSESGGIVKLFEYLPMRFRQRVINDDYASYSWIAGGRKYSEKDPGYIGTCQSAMKDVGLLLRILGCFTQNPSKILKALPHDTDSCTKLPSQDDSEGTDDVKMLCGDYTYHLLGSEFHRGMPYFFRNRFRI